MVFILVAFLLLVIIVDYYSHLFILYLSCAIYIHTPARKSSTNFQLYYFVIQICSTNWLGHGHGYTPSPPTKSFPTKSPRVELSGRLPTKIYGHDNSHPLELRVCLSQTL